MNAADIPNKVVVVGAAADFARVRAQLDAEGMGGVEVMTPSGTIELTRQGTYHIDSGAPGPDGQPQHNPVRGSERRRYHQRAGQGVRQKPRAQGYSGLQLEPEL